jgi:UTP--glucose-1-phosphate uridylyltransferase
VPVRKAVIPPAGRGIRLLPVTKTQPKEMLQIVNKPLIQLAVEEAVDAGIRDVIIIVAHDRRVLFDYFGPSYALDTILLRKNDNHRAQEMARLENLANITYIYQPRPLGLGYALSLAQAAVGNEPFAMILPDELIDNHESGLCQILPVFERYGSSVIAVETVDSGETPMYGTIKPESVSERVYKVAEMVDAPGYERASSCLSIAGRYVLTPAIFNALARTTPDKNGEIQLSSALSLLLTEQPVYALELAGTRYDVGDPLGWLEAQVVFGLKHPEIGDHFREKLRRLI